eukprot:4819568-Ditylum_brightwellii.AAC.1
MALRAMEYDLKVPLKEWYFPHWPIYYDYATVNLYVHHQDITKKKEYFTRAKTLSGYQPSQ